MASDAQPMKVRLIKGVAQVQADWLQLYLITNLENFPPEQHLEVVEAALKGGAKDIQLREKNLPLEMLHPLAVVLNQMTKKYGARLYINDRVDIALMVGADGVHLPEGGLPPNEVKACYPHLLVGVSTHSLEGAKQAEQDGADFITFSPIYDTPSKREYGPPQGVDALKAVCDAVSLPVLALGGINLENITEVRKQGAHGAALIRGIWNSSNIETETLKYIEALRGDPS